MDPVTHLLAGLTLARAGANRLTPSATAIIAIGAVLPDIDFPFRYGATPTFLQFQQGWTHSLPGIASLGALLALPFWLRARRRCPQPRLYGKLLLAGWLGLLGHLLLDWTTATGVHFFWPFNPTWYALDWFSLVDPWVLAVLLLGLTVPTLFRLISEEIGARATARGERHGAWAAIVLFLLLCALRAPLHAQALTALDAQTYRGRTPVRVGAFPTPVNPFLWRGVAETPETYELLEVSLAGPRRGTTIRFTHYKPSPSPVLEAVERTAVGRTFLEFVRFPLAQVEPRPNGHRVVLRDLRFARATLPRRTLIAWIELDENFEVTDAGFGFREEN
ncbi:MAG: metal-dependent hydrolase [Terriglobia bacterium]